MPQEQTIEPADSSQTALNTLLDAARTQQATLHLVIQFLRRLLGSERSLATPNGSANQASLERMPAALRSAARQILRWSRRSEAAFSVLSAAVEKLEAEVFATRRASPLGAKRLEFVGEVRRRYAASGKAPRLNASVAYTEVLAEFRGEPLSPQVMKAIETLRPDTVCFRPFRRLTFQVPAPRWIEIELLPDEFSIASITWCAQVPVTRHARGPVFGRLAFFFETGCEGVMWTLADEENFDRSKLHFIEEGDHLVIQDGFGVELWSGVIDPDREIGYHPYPNNPSLGQPTALGLWIHWTQRGFSPDEWAKHFCDPANRYYGVLTKAKS